MNIRVLVAVVLLTPATAFAQGTPGPFGGLFGRTPERIGRDYTLFDVRSHVSAQVDDQAFNSSNDLEDGLTGVAAASASALFEHRTSRFSTRMRGAAVYHEFLQETPVGATAYEAGGTMNWRVATRLAIDATAGYVYSPFFQFHPTLATSPYLSGVVVPMAPFVASLQSNTTVNASTGFTSYYSKRSTLSASVLRRQTRFDRRPDFDYTANGVQALWTRKLRRDMTLRFGYSREQVRQEAVSSTEFIHESIEAGVDFARALSLSRSTTIAFDTQTSIIKRPNARRVYRLNGGLSLMRWFGRSWLLGASVQRNTEFLPGFVEPLLSDTASATLGGRLADRAELIFTVSGGRGEFGQDSGSFSTAAATTQFNLALTRRFGLFSQYAYYLYEIPPGISPVAAVDRLSRQAVTVGAAVWIPILQRERAPSDTR